MCQQKHLYKNNVENIQCVENENNFIKMRNIYKQWNTKIYGFNKICASNENDIKIIFVIFIFGVEDITHKDILWLKRSLDSSIHTIYIYTRKSLKLSFIFSSFFLFQLTKLLTSTHTHTPNHYMIFMMN